MRENTLTEKLTNRGIIASSAALDVISRYDYKYPNNCHTENLSFETKKLIEKYDCKNNSKDNLNYEKFFQESNISENTKNYKNYIYKEGDSYDILINKNKNLKRLFEQVNCSLLLSLQKQEKIEIKYETEKKEILEHLTNIQKKYEVYAKSHKQMNYFKEKLNELTNDYNHLMHLYLKINKELKQFDEKITKIINGIENFIEINKGKDSANILSFEYLLNLKSELEKKFIIEIKTRPKEIEFIYFKDDTIYNQTKDYYLNSLWKKDFPKINEKIFNKLNTNANI